MVMVSEIERKRQDRKAGIAAAERVAEVSGKGAAVAKTATQKRLSSLKGRAAEGLASAISGAPQTGLGARAAAAADVAKRQGTVEGDVKAGGLEKEQDAKEGAAEAQLDVAKFKKEAGSSTLDLRKRRTEIDARIATFTEENKHWYGDDEDAFAKAVLAEIADDPPEIRDAIIKRYKDHSDWGSANTDVWDA